MTDLPVFSKGGQWFYWTWPQGDGTIVSVIPLMLGRARVIHHYGYSPAEYQVLEGW